ncbi:MAG TPA: ABC transporter ATP-binding protein [Patescibacteria group bacterium]|nr:ABC transporter ATP-binding protein [Patescibacteria group bacterium]
MLSSSIFRHKVAPLASTKAVSLRQAWLKYRVEFRQEGRIVPEDFWALKGINLEVGKGQIVGLIGENGAGKTSLLKLVAGMLAPDKGSVEVNGTVSALMEIGAGLQHDLTGRENIYLVSSLFGLTKAQVDERFEDIVRFTEIGKFIDAPVKIYSQGMYMRLAFAIAIHVHPDILLLDDMFVVGDVYAQHKCVQKIFELKDQGMTILFALQDLEMLKRICSRGVFLREGVIIKDGPIDAVCSYYMETVGSREGIGIVQKDPLGVIFNNGKLIVRWNNQTITCNLGGHSSMRIAGREYLSTAAEWQVQKAGPGGDIIAVGRWPDVPVRQQWKIRVLSEKEFLWDITVQPQERVPLEKIDVRTFLADAYKSWFTLQEEKDFPDVFLHITQGNCPIIDDSVGGMVGARGAGTVPTVVFEQQRSNGRTVCQAGNTGSEIHGRFIQHRPSLSDQDTGCADGACTSFVSRVMLFDPAQEHQVQEYLGRLAHSRQESAVIRKGPLALYCRDHRVDLYWQDIPLTREMGLNTKFKCQDRDYDAGMWAKWDVSKKSETEIDIRVTWDELPCLAQTWRLSLPSDDTVSWQVETSSANPVKLRQKQVELVLADGYEGWFTAEEQGDFEMLEKKGSGVVLNRYINTHMGVKCAGSSEAAFLPTVLFSQEDAVPRASFFSKRQDQESSTALRYLEAARQESMYSPSGISAYFAGKIQIGQSVQYPMGQPAGRPQLRTPDLRLKKMSVAFDHGKGRFFWKKAELTKGLGMYASVFSAGMWYDSSQAFWEPVEQDRNRLKVVGHWCWVPMTQRWEISLLDAETIEWKIERRAWDNFLPEREQVNIMLSDTYRAWVVPGQRQEQFPAGFKEHNGAFWDRQWDKTGAFPIGLEKCRVQKRLWSRYWLPSVTFACPEHCRVRCSAIENTDNLFRARLLQYELEPAGKDQAYFTGRIKIGI